MKHYRAVILVLASNNSIIYNNCRKIWKKYMNSDKTIKVYFVYGKLHEPLDNSDENDLIFNEVPESYPTYIKKTILAMKEIQTKITYDYFIRTNLSTFWDFKNLHLHLNDLPNKECYSGDGPLRHLNYCYLSGTDTIVTPEMIKSIIENEDILDYNLTEDIVMGNYFNKILNVPFLPNRICFMENIINKDIDIIDSIIEKSIESNIDHYRVKNNNREEIDLFIYIRLLNKIYNINIQ